MYVLFYVCVSIFPYTFPVTHFQWWPLLPGLLPWQNLVHRGVLCVPGVCGLPGWHRAGCDGHGPLHPAAWFWPAMCRAHRRLHEETQGQIHPRGRAEEGELSPISVAQGWFWVAWKELAVSGFVLREFLKCWEPGQKNMIYSKSNCDWKYRWFCSDDSCKLLASLMHFPCALCFLSFSLLKIQIMKVFCICISP